MSLILEIVNFLLENDKWLIIVFHAQIFALTRVRLKWQINMCNCSYGIILLVTKAQVLICIDLQKTFGIHWKFFKTVVEKNGDINKYIGAAKYQKHFQNLSSKTTWHDKSWYMGLSAKMIKKCKAEKKYWKSFFKKVFACLWRTMWIC